MGGCTRVGAGPGGGVACRDTLLERAVFDAVANGTCVPACGAPNAVVRCAPEPAPAPSPAGAPAPAYQAVAPVSLAPFSQAPPAPAPSSGAVAELPAFDVAAYAELASLVASGCLGLGAAKYDAGRMQEHGPWACGSFVVSAGAHEALVAGRCMPECGAGQVVVPCTASPAAAPLAGTAAPAAEQPLPAPAAAPLPAGYPPTRPPLVTTAPSPTPETSPPPAAARAALARGCEAVCAAPASVARCLGGTPTAAPSLDAWLPAASALAPAPGPAIVPAPAPAPALLLVEPSLLFHFNFSEAGVPVTGATSPPTPGPRPSLSPPAAAPAASRCSVLAPGASGLLRCGSLVLPALALRGLLDAGCAWHVAPTAPPHDTARIYFQAALRFPDTVSAAGLSAGDFAVLRGPDPSPSPDPSPGAAPASAPDAPDGALAPLPGPSAEACKCGADPDAPPERPPVSSAGVVTSIGRLDCATLMLDGYLPVHPGRAGLTASAATITVELREGRAAAACAGGSFAGGDASTVVTIRPTPRLFATSMALGAGGPATASPTGLLTALTQSLAVSGPAVRQAAGRPSASRCRTSVVVRADAESRRAVLGGLLAAAGLVAVRPAAAIDLFDNRKVRDNGFDLIYEARDLDLPQATRDGFTQARQGLDATKKRVSESEKRIDSSLEPFIKKNYWTAAREELRLQVGTLRFDLNALAESKDKASRKKALSLKKDFLKKAEELDYALRMKNEEKAAAALTATKSALDVVLQAV
ncbi:hypothetical protein WJX81_006704 [Elliptochloris bilobata]|uniref:Uncharacterized protein n=1 Tax=Elliptochloris bilobata TaxID=381761 RepID=A0AAW1R1H2_9CHLO